MVVGHSRGQQCRRTIIKLGQNRERSSCKHCGETVYNSNAMGWRLISQLLISKRNGGELPQELSSNAHFFYDRRIIDINDQIPKS